MRGAPATIANVPGPLKSPLSLSFRSKPIPWLLLLQAALMIDRRRRSLSREERSRLAHLLGRSKGLPNRLTEAERAELKVIAAKLDLVGMGRDLLPLARPGKGKAGGKV